MGAGSQMIDKATRRAAFAKTSGRCWFCGLHLAVHICHLWARSKGGPDTLDNLVGGCVECNMDMGQDNLESYRKIVTHRIERALSFLKSCGYEVPEFRGDHVFHGERP